jgi:hypothetical protein
MVTVHHGSEGGRRTGDNKSTLNPSQGLSSSCINHPPFGSSEGLLESPTSCNLTHVLMGMKRPPISP